MKAKLIIAAAFAALAIASEASAQETSYTPLTDTNLQIQYDFGKDRKFVTITYEMFHNDAWGNTFFFVDLDMNFKNADGKNVGPSLAYTELSRSLNFWKDSAMKDFSLQVEYDGGLGGFNGGSYPVNHAFLLGANYCFHSSDFRYTLTLQLLYKHFLGLKSNVPMQATAVWGCQDLFGAKGLRFSGFADVWCEGSNVVFLSEPQLWYSVGQWFNCPNLNLGGEVELAYNFAGVSGFRCRPCLGVKWVF